MFSKAEALCARTSAAADTGRGAFVQRMPARQLYVFGCSRQRWMGDGRMEHAAQLWSQFWLPSLPWQLEEPGKAST